MIEDESIHDQYDLYIRTITKFLEYFWRQRNANFMRVPCWWRNETNFARKVNKKLNLRQFPTTCADKRGESNSIQKQPRPWTLNALNGYNGYILHKLMYLKF